MELELDVPVLAVLLAGVALVVGVLAGAADGVLVVFSLAVEVVVLSVPAAVGFSDVSLPPGFILSE
ncbi:conserved hypothetical protein [Nitrospira defluvii]|uniref:Uncharacterized protein n=1 Tax=Nitrospira defluvii TaxID=330214 RepID=A0ABM8RSX2_9BACT|nr:conserved hypothetical protein [Nitrospira defluvii]